VHRREAFQTDLRRLSEVLLTEPVPAPTLAVVGGEGDAVGGVSKSSGIL
jgi:hypothetical protein